jgi:hypothetical protein
MIKLRYLAVPIAFVLMASAAIAASYPTHKATAAPHKPASAMASSMTITMHAQNGSKQNGTAMLKQNGKNLWVKVSVSNEPKGGSEPAHIHPGYCATLNPAPWKVLTNVVNGTSITTVPNLTIAALKASKYAINVHESAKNIKRYVSCGDIK